MVGTFLGVNIAYLIQTCGISARHIVAVTFLNEDYRGNCQSRLLELKLQHHAIPYDINSGTSFFVRSEVKEIMFYLRLLINQDDDNAALRVVNTPKREIVSSTQEKALEEDLASQYVEKLRKFTGMMDNISRNIQISDDPMRYFGT